MPVPSSSEPGAGLRRRTALGGLLALGALTAGCTGSARKRRPVQRTSTPAGPDIDPDVALAATVLASEQQVLDLVQATMRRHRRLRKVLVTARDVHREHTRLLTDAVPSNAPSPSGLPTAGTHLAADPAKALAALARAEDRLSLVEKRSAFSAESGAFARILGSMAAAAAQQAVLQRGHAHAGAAR